MIAKGSLEVKLRTVWTDGKAEVGRVREEKEQKREDQRRGRVRRKKMQAREKIAKSRNTVFFQWFVAPEGRSVGSLKRRVRSHAARWEMKSCTPWWREAHFQVKMCKAHQGRSTFGSWDVQKVHTVAARSTCPSQNVQSTPVSEHFWKLRCPKSARRCGAKHISKSKLSKTEGLGALLDVQMSFRVAGAKDCAPCQKWAKTWRLWSISKNDGKRGTFEEDLERCIFRSRRNTRDMFIRDVRRSGRWFPERGCILEHQIFSFGKMILCNRCSTLYDLASLFRGRHNTSETWARKIAKRIGMRPSALHSTLHYKRMSRRIASFLMLPISKNWGSLAELLRFWSWKKNKMDEVSQNCFGFKLADCR